MSITQTPIQLISPVGSGAGQQLISSGPATVPFWGNTAMTNETFQSGIKFTPGTTVSLTLSGTYGSVANIWVYFDASYQGPDQIASLVGNVLTFTSAIPVGVTNVYVKGGNVVSANVPSASSVTVPMLGSDVTTLIAATQNGYVGSATTDPTTRLDGSNLKSGDRYYNSSLGLEKTYSGTSWFIPNIGTVQLAGSSGSGLVGNGAEMVSDSLNALQLANYSTLRAYSGPRKSVYITGWTISALPSGISGLFVRDDSDTVSVDNAGTIIVATNGTRWKRQFSGAYSIRWFGAIGDGITNDSAVVQAAINSISISSTGSSVIIFDRATSPGWRLFNIQLKSNVSLRAESFTPGSRCIQDVVFYPPDGSSAGWQIYTDPSNPTSYCGVQGIVLHGRAAARTTGADNGYTAGFGGISFGPGFQRSIESNFIYNWGEQGIMTLSSNQTSIKSNLLYNCVYYRIRSAYIGAADLQETDSYISENEWGTSSQTEGIITNASPYLCAVYYRLGGNNFCTSNVCETSEIGCVDNSFYSRHVSERYELNYANGCISLDGGQAYTNPYFRNNSRALRLGYSDFKLATSYKPARMVATPVFEYDSESILSSYNIEDTITQGNMTCYTGRQPTYTSFAWVGQLWNDQVLLGVPTFNGQNAIRNSSGQGVVIGTPGTLPTNWTIGGNSGLTTSIVATGIENNLPYIDIQFTGTATGTYFEIDFDTTTSVSAALNQTWTSSIFAKLSGGTLAGSLSVGISEYSITPSFLGSGSSTASQPNNTSLGTQRISYTRTLSYSTTSYVRPYIQGLVTNGAVVNMIIRISLPQLEAFSSAGTPIPTIGVSKTFSSSTMVVFPFQGQNYITNSSLAGAVVGSPGTVPTNWNVSGGGGLTTTVIGLGNENGVPYIDINISGTSTSTYWQILFESASNITAANGQVWSASFFMKLPTSVNTNIISYQTVMNEYASGSYATGGSLIFTPAIMSVNLVSGRAQLSRTLSGTGTTTVTAGVQMSYSLGVVVNTTIRLGLPQLEKRSAPGQPINTFGTVVSLF